MEILLLIFGITWALVGLWTMLLYVIYGMASAEIWRYRMRPRPL